jgi:predicted deacetylase
MTARSLVVSIHDVSPVSRDAVTFMLAALARLGVQRTSLLVVPDYHHQGNITADADFTAWLRDQVAAGHEAVLHGYYHHRERGRAENLRTRLFTRVYTAGEGEFFEIGLEQARALLARGRNELAECAGQAPAGFIAPAWLLSRPGEQAAREIGFAYTARLKSVLDLASRRAVPSQSLCWSVRSEWRRIISRRWNALLFQRLRFNPLLRISIHPPDLLYFEIWRQIQKLAARAVETRAVTTYGGFVAAAANG